MARYKLSMMMLLQYMMYAVWWVPLAAYLTNLEVGAVQKALIISSMAIGCMASPVIGMLADRFWAGQKVLSGLNLINAIMLFMAGTTNNPDILFICLLIAMLGYMPSWGLTSSIAMVHLPSEQFPKVRVFGSIGWVASGVFSIIFIKFLNIDFDGTNIPFYCGAGVSLFAAITNLFLPNTPPLAIKKFGLRKVMVLGLVALVIRYLSFYAGGVLNQNWMFYIGILIHGLIFGFFFVGGQIYINKKAPAELKSQAQGFIFLVTFGLGLLVGNFISSEIISYYTSEAGYNWNAIWGITTLSSVVLLVFFILLFKNEDKTIQSKA